ncbi:hypothetical protein DPMN_113169 [Dreissena polymorpha]|uniref:Uncharacterized protein n=1 Tax=Dreissena polymorpha TaxID=45954 RepID=A0A9D4KH11_DREPO|nr:hypothetical protein DPMN_113169 [Dreissena polymorpha]
MLHLLMVGVTRLLIGQGKRNSEWMELIQKVVDGTVTTTMSELLSFISGASSILPLRDFQKPIDMHFFTKEDGVNRFPYVSKCSPDLWLPRGHRPETLSALLLQSVNCHANMFIVRMVSHFYKCMGSWLHIMNNNTNIKYVLY